MTSPDRDPFDLLGVSELNSDEVINAAWRRRIRLCHPDYATGDADRERRLAESIALNRAHDVLLDPALKAEAVLDRRRRSTTYGSTFGSPAGAPPQSAQGQDSSSDTWAGTRWSGSYRGGGHPEARGAWSYSEPPAPPQTSAEPEASGSLIRRNPALRILAVTVQVFVELGWGVINLLSRLIIREPLDHDGL